jgi:hypothetical protein
MRHPSRIPIVFGGLVMAALTCTRSVSAPTPAARPRKRG